MKIGDVIKLNGVPVTVESIDGNFVDVTWFEVSTLCRGRISLAIAWAGR